MSKKRKGRPSLEYDEQELYKIVQHFRENVRPTGLIKYAEIYRYHIELHEKNPELYSKTFSQDFWKREGQPGRKVIDTANAIRTLNIVRENEIETTIPNIIDVIDRYANNKEKLHTHLNPIVVELRRITRENDTLNDKMDKLKIQLINEKEEKRRLMEKVSILEETLAKLFYYSEKKGTPLENLLDINNANKRIKRALIKAFDYDSLPDFYFKVTNDYASEAGEPLSSENVVPFKKPNKSIVDEYKDRF